MKSEESQIQSASVNWFRYEYPKWSKNLFSVPNGGYRHIATARAIKREGAVAGVADLLLLLPTDTYHGLLIEMKTAKGKLSKNQKMWLNHMSHFDYLPVVCHSVTDFQVAVNRYIDLVPRQYKQ